MLTCQGTLAAEMFIAAKCMSAAQVQCAVGTDEPIFQPFPPEVVLHSYEPFKQYQATLSLRNNDKVWRNQGSVHMQCQHSAWKDQTTARSSADSEAVHIVIDVTWSKAVQGSDVPNLHSTCNQAQVV